MPQFLTIPERDTLDEMLRLFEPEEIHFTLVGGAACREYGLTREVKGLDFVVNPYPRAVSLLASSGRFSLYGEPDPNWTNVYAKGHVK